MKIPKNKRYLVLYFRELDLVYCKWVIRLYILDTNRAELCSFGFSNRLGFPKKKSSLSFIKRRIFGYTTKLGTVRYEDLNPDKCYDKRRSIESIVKDIESYKKNRYLNVFYTV